MSKFVTLVLEPSFNDEYGEYANLPVFNAHGDVVGYTGGEVPEKGNPCEFYVMDEEGFPVCHSSSENAALRQLATMLHRCARGMLRDLAPSCVDRSKGGCGMDCTDNGERCCMELLERRMRKLGIEVGE